jgi:hypothetical protein
MQVGPFDFLLSLPESQARQWLIRYLLGERTDPAVDVPFDYGRLEFLLNEVSPIPDMALPLRIGDLAGSVLREVVATRSLHSVRPSLVKALFTLVESLPVSETVVTLLSDLAATGAVRDWSVGDGTDFHLLTLRALVLHQRAASGRIDRLIDFWKRQATDLPYASIAIQGLLRIAPREAFGVVPDFVERASNERPRLPLANLLFAVAAELGGDLTLWRLLAARLLQKPTVFEIVKEGFSKIQLARSNPDAWRLLDEMDKVDSMDALTASPIADLDETVLLRMRNHDVRYEPRSEPALDRAA